MKNQIKRILTVTVVLCCITINSANALEEVNSSLREIINFRQYSSSFASSGQPSQSQFEMLKQQRFERIVYIAFTNSGDNAIAEEDTIVKALNMEYLQIPVDFQNPLAAEFYIFADAMRRYPDKRTLLHCQVNARATAFSFLYRVIYENIPMTQAKQDMNTVWQPSEKWRDFIFAVLKENNLSPMCKGCDWTSAK